MGAGEHDFLDALRATFRLEAAEHVQTIASGLLALEQSADPDARPRLVDAIFRAAHSLKGAARAVDLIAVETLCQSLEDTFATWRSQETAPSRDDLDRAHAAVDAIRHALSAPTAAPPPSPVQAGPGWRNESPPPAGDPSPAAPDESVRIAVSKLDAQLVNAEEMLVGKLMTAKHAEDVRDLGYRLETWRREFVSFDARARAMRPAVAAVARTHPHLNTELNALLDFLDWNVDYLNALDARVAAISRGADRDTLAIGKLVDDLLESSKTLLLLPFGTVAAQLPTLVRNLCRDQGKQAELVISGEHIEIDKRILEEIKDPLIHLLRNCIDHGIEPPEQRQRAGKPARATITVAVTQGDGNKVQVLVKDDGAGLDLAQVRHSAIEHRVLPADEANAIDERAAARLIFASHVSTSTMVTRVSGRGLGLAIVREKVERLGGTVSVESERGAGTQFSMVLPSLLATFRGILIEAARQRFVVPLSHVERVIRVAPEQIGTIEGRPTVSLGAKAVAFTRLHDVLGLPAADGDVADSRTLTLMVLGSGDHRIAFAVDAVLDEQEVLVKPLQKPLSRVRNIAGATVLPSGQMAAILNVADLLTSARHAGVTMPALRSTVSDGQPTRRSILVAEDSITSRMLMRTILESAGFKVTTAVDGLEAFALLRAHRFDLLVSDVDMPRLNGFELTARLRADARLASLPVILVTALETVEDRGRGIDVGADAYIGKSTFDQRDLLDTVRRLL
jgi:two-component system chemotaxis sensor kinase CheA